MRKLATLRSLAEVCVLAGWLSLGVAHSALGAEAPARGVEFPHGLTSYRDFGPVGPYYPEGAARKNIQGSAQLNCHIGSDHRLDDCRVVSETPAEIGFSDAALIMAKRHWIVATPKADGAAEASDERGLFTVEFKIRGR